MYILVPSILILISLAGMVVIIQRKMPYLRKLSPESHQVSDNLVDDYFPELMQWWRSIPWHTYRQNTLRELEKLLRRMRLALLKVDHLSEALIKKVRKVHVSAQVENGLSETKKAEETKILELKEPERSPLDELKAREQQLIIEISQDPKNATLYETLGDLYVKMGNEADAREAYEAALGFKPDNRELARKYSALLKKDAVA